MAENFYNQSTENTVLLRGEPQLALSPRQKEVLTYRAMGHTQSEIAEELGISAETVKNHISTTDLKLGASGITDAISVAIVREEIDTEVLASQYDWDKYNDLNDSQKDTLAAISEIGDVTIDTLAFKLGSKPRTVKGRLSQIYSRLGIPSAISQAWLFAHLMPENLKRTS